MDDHVTYQGRLWRMTWGIQTLPPVTTARLRARPGRDSPDGSSILSERIMVAPEFVSDMVAELRIRAYPVDTEMMDRLVGAAHPTLGR